MKEGVHIAMVSKLGQIKKTPIEEFDTTRIARTSKCFNLSSNDELISVGLLKGNSDILVVNCNGLGSLFNETEINPVSLKAGGVKAMTGVTADSYIASMLTFDPKESCKLGMITKEHGGRLVEYSSITRTSRLGAKIALYKSFKSEPQHLVNFFKFNRKAETMHVHIILNNKIRAVAKLEETKPLPLESYLKEYMQ